MAVQIILGVVFVLLALGGSGAGFLTPALTFFLLQCVCVCFCFQVRVYSGVHTHQAWRQWAQAQQLLVLLKGEKLQRKDVDK